MSEPIDSFDERREDEYYEFGADDQGDDTIRRPISADPPSHRHSSIFTAQQKRQSIASSAQSRRQSLIIEPVALGGSF